MNIRTTPVQVLCTIFKNLISLVTNYIPRTIEQVQSHGASRITWTHVIISRGCLGRNLEQRPKTMYFHPFIVGEIYNIYTW